MPFCIRLLLPHVSLDLLYAVQNPLTRTLQKLVSHQLALQTCHLTLEASFAAKNMVLGLTWRMQLPHASMPGNEQLELDTGAVWTSDNLKAAPSSISATMTPPMLESRSFLQPCSSAIDHKITLFPTVTKWTDKTVLCCLIASVKQADNGVWSSWLKPLSAKPQM